MFSSDWFAGFGPEAFDEYEYEDNKVEFLVKERNWLIDYKES